MLRLVHSLPGLIAAALVVVLSISGAILAIEPAIERVGTDLPSNGQMSVAALASKITARRVAVERIVRTPSGSIVVHHAHDGEGLADRINPRTGAPLAPRKSSPFMRSVTNLHRSLYLGQSGRAAAGFGAFALIILSASGAMMLAKRLGRWGAILRPIRGQTLHRLHSELARAAVAAVFLSGLTGSYMSLATFDLVPDGMTVDAAIPEKVGSGPHLAIGRIRALQTVDVNDLRELTFPDPTNAADTYELTTTDGVGRIDAATGAMLTYEPHSVARRLYETIYMLHTGQGAWPLALLLGLGALSVPVLSVSGAAIWWKRRRAHPRIRSNAAPQLADTIVLVGSEGGATWAFAATLHRALTEAGHTVHVAPMNGLSYKFRSAQRLLVFTSTYGDGAAPASADRFLERLSRTQLTLPYAVLGFGDRSFPHFCRFADEVDEALRAKGWPSLLPAFRIDRQSEQDFARWGADIGSAIGTPLKLSHVTEKPKTVRLSLVERTDYGCDVQAPTSVFRFVTQNSDSKPGRLRRLPHRSPGLPKFTAGDLVGIFPPASNTPRFYSLASSSQEGVLEICVRKTPGGLCSSYLHGLSPGSTIEAFIRPNPDFRAVRGRAPLVLIGAGAGIAPLVGIIRHNSHNRPIHLYWGGRHPASDFLYEGELSYFLSDRRLTRCRTAFSRLAHGLYVQDRIAAETSVLRDLITNGAQVMVCGGREMAAGVASAIDSIVRPLGLDVSTLKAEGRYVEDVY